jgi:hypothetical protein
MRHFLVGKNVVLLLQAHESTVSSAGIVFQLLYAAFIKSYSKKQQLGKTCVVNMSHLE